MTALDLSPIETPAVQRALVGVAESLEMDASRRSARVGNDVHVAELREEIALLRGVSSRLTPDQSPAASRAPEREALEGLDDEALRGVIGACEELLDARFLDGARRGRREVDARYTSRRSA